MVFNSGTACARHTWGEGVLVLRGEKDAKCRIDVGLRGQDRLRCEATLLWVKQSLL